MKRHPALHSLSHDHHQGLILAQQLKKHAPQYKGMSSTPDGKKEYTISFYNTELKEHFENEEKILFPAVLGKDKNIDRMILEIINEHRKMELYILDLQNPGEIEDTLDKLGMLLEQHIRKEERELFPAIENILTESELSRLEIKLKKNK